MDDADLIERIATGRHPGTSEGIGADATGTLTVTIGPQGALERVEVGDLDPKVRTVDGLREALLEAEQHAEGARVLVEAARCGVFDRASGPPPRPVYAAPPAPDPRLISYIPPHERGDYYHRYVAEGGLDARRRAHRLSWGEAATGYLRVGFNQRGVAVDLTADELWLTAVEPRQLAGAFAEAISASISRAIQEGGDHGRA
ncbi:hypothetical protein [Nocardioides insulae]|uniref:hypothetical protein n=1 Tax=Nocardioides insulae TaxID=394734 RepID=UPI000411539B|nr:hypothetical protein [Nocardioides insulae]